MEASSARHELEATKTHDTSMAMVRSGDVFRRVDALEYAWCLRLNRGCRMHAVRRAFAIASRLGDGAFWYTSMLLMPAVYGHEGLQITLRMALAGLVGLALYKWLKSRLLRERPCVALLGIVQGTPPLDRYSFPSGHTLHAVSFSTLIIADVPQLAWLYMPFSVLVAASRVVLGLHYPSDVLAGALLGGALAWLTLLVIPLG